MSNWKEEFEQVLTQIKTLERKEASDEEKPFDEKYAARKLYPKLFELSESCEDPEIKAGILFYLNSRLGTNYFDTEENGESSKQYHKAVLNYDEINSEKTQGRFKAELVRVLNNLGFYEVNCENYEKGLEYLKRSETIGDHLREGIPKTNETNEKKNEENSEAAKEEINVEQKKDEKSGKIRVPFFEKTVPSAHKIEKHSTLTSFFLAQTYAKMGRRDIAAQYCGKTLERQLDNDKKYGTRMDPIELTNNCLGLAQFYRSELNISQALYLLDGAAKTLLPKNRAELASIKFMRGNVLRDFFEQNLNMIIEKTPIDRELEKQFNQISLRIAFAVPAEAPTLKIEDNYEALKPMFAKILALYTEAKAVFEDGHVTELCELVKEINTLYSLLLRIETDQARIEVINQRRLAAIEPLLSQLNSQYYKKQVVELTSAAADVHMVIMESLCKQYTSLKKPKIALKANGHGQIGLKLWGDVLAYFDSIQIEDDQDVQGVVSCLLSRGRLFSLIIESDRERLIENLKQALGCYERIIQLIKTHKEKKGSLEPLLEKQLSITEEYYRLMPIKIQALSKAP